MLGRAVIHPVVLAGYLVVTVTGIDDKQPSHS